MTELLSHKCYTVRGLPEQQILNQFQQPTAPLLQHQLQFSDGLRQQQQQQQHQSQQHTSFSNPTPPLRMMSAAGKNHNSKGN